MERKYFYLIFYVVIHFLLQIPSLITSKAFSFAHKKKPQNEGQRLATCLYRVVWGVSRVGGDAPAVRGVAVDVDEAVEAGEVNDGGTVFVVFEDALREALVPFDLGRDV
jgi:hypothetical protein